MKKKQDYTEYPTIPSLVGKKVYLKPASPDDFMEIHGWFNASDPQLQSCHRIKIVSPQEKVELIKKRESRDDEAAFVIVAKDDNRLIGHMNYFHLNMLNRSAELGYLIAPHERETGFAKEALELLIKYLFLELDLNRVYAQTASINKASVRLLDSLGFQLDGTLRQHHYYQGQLYDDLLYSLLRFEYNLHE